MDMDLSCRIAAAVLAAALVFSIVFSGLIIGLPHGIISWNGPRDNSQVESGSLIPASGSPGLTDAASTDMSQAEEAPPDVTYRTITERKDAMGVNPVLMENPQAVNPTYGQVVAFLSTDNTVKNKYVVPTFTCADFAVELQNHAEERNMKCGYASLKFVNKPDGHAVDVFDTIDRGLIYVDTTGGKPIICCGLCPGESYYNLGVIASVTNYW
jgi:hypothetical protein